MRNPGADNLGKCAGGVPEEGDVGKAATMVGGLKADNGACVIQAAGEAVGRRYRVIPDDRR